MAYENFIPTVWAEGIDRELERLSVFAEDCNTQYEGAVKKKGDSVRILGVGKPTIKRITKDARNNNIDDPEDVEDTSVVMQINQIAYFNYMVGDIDKAQMVSGVREALSAETSEGLADEVDRDISAKVADGNVKKLYSAATKIVAGDAGTGEKNVLDALDEALQLLYENDVKPNTYIVATVSPRFFTLFKKAYIKADTDNSEMLKHGKIAMYGNLTIKMSNNVLRSDDGKEDNIMIRTKRAIAFAKPLTHVEAYRPEKKFADAVKGFVLFDSKVVRPKEIINLNVKYA